MPPIAHPFSISQRVYYQHTDAGGVVYHGTYLDFMEAARSEYLQAHGFDLAELAARDAVMFIVRRLRVDYRRPGRLNNLLTVTVEVAKVGDPRACRRR
jgi:acyl-CoA thioester hydrolase